MRRTGQGILLAGAAMLAAGFSLPFVVGPALPPGAYDVLQIGGMVLALIGLVARGLGGRAQGD